MLFHCIYTSVQTRTLAADELAWLVNHSREQNAAKGLTGVLLYVDNTFFQVLEGSAEAIDELYSKILVDPRHTHITRIIFESIPRRFFADSDMSLTTLSPQELCQLLGSQNEEKKTNLLADLDEGRAKKLLRAFSDGRWRASFTPPAEASLA